MSTHKYLEKIVCVVLAICILMTIVFVNAENLGITQAENQNSYENMFFGELSINTIDIIVEDSEWQNLLDNASDKEYINSNLLINGELFTNIAIRAKGNSSLQQVQSSDSDRYSLKIEFDHYDKTKTFHGLDKLCLNNIIQDNTYMKDFLAYTLMAEFGVPSPLVNYASVTVNGEHFGFFLAVEAIEEAFLERNYGTNYGNAFKPETSSMMGGGGDAMRGEMPEMGQIPTEMLESIYGMSDEELAELFKSFMNGSLDLENFEITQGQVPQMGNTEMGSTGREPMGDAQMGMQGEIPQVEMTQGQVPQMGNTEMGSTGREPMGDAQMGMQGEIPQTEMTQGQVPQMGNTEMGSTGREPMGDAQIGMQGEIPQAEMTQGQVPQMGNTEMGSTGREPMGDAQMGMQGEIPQAEMTQGQVPQMGNTEMGSTGREPMTGGQQGMSGGQSQSSNGYISSSLGYDGDDFENYAYIFDNAVSDISDRDKEVVINALKQISEQEQLEDALDIEGVIRYFVVHNFLTNFDSYTGEIMHNYYIYEDDGKISMLPWDYNLSFASFQTSYSTEALVNFPIDTPVSSGTVESRAMLAWIFSNDEYTEIYHNLFDEFLNLLYNDNYIYDLIDDVLVMINDSVQTDTTSFTTYENFVKGVETLKEVISLRIESISGQLDGTIPSTTQGQTADSGALISASHINITDTGSTNSGGGDRGGDRTQMNGGTGTTQNSIKPQLSQQMGGGNMGNQTGDRFVTLGTESSNVTSNNTLTLIIAVGAMIISLISIKLYKKYQ